MAASISMALRERFAELAAELVSSAPIRRSRMELRFYPRGGLSINLNKGLFYDHAAGLGGDALDLVRHLRGGTTAEAMVWARTWLGHIQLHPVPRSAPILDDAATRRSRLSLARRLWVDALPAPGTPVEGYLRSRGLQLPPSHARVLRYHPHCPRGSNERLPAMVALMQHAGTGEPVGVHRTFLRLDRTSKAEGQAKAMLGGAGVVHLVDAAEVTLGLGLAEGIETALALTQHAGWAPVWACGSAGGIARFPVLSGIETLMVFGDSDDGGASILAARACARRWVDAGRHVTIELPPAGEDWADVAARVAS